MNTKKIIIISFWTVVFIWLSLNYFFYGEYLEYFKFCFIESSLQNIYPNILILILKNINIDLKENLKDVIILTLTFFLILIISYKK
jgi:hypothetical protein